MGSMLSAAFVAAKEERGVSRGDTIGLSELEDHNVGNFKVWRRKHAIRSVNVAHQR